MRTRWFSGLTKLFVFTCMLAHPGNSNGALGSKRSQYTNADTLRLLTVVLRHGERAPQSTYKNDPFKNNSMSPFGWGQLVQQGRINQYNQGNFLRQRYDEFLGNYYSPQVFWLQSTSVDRAKMSALLISAALWQPNERQAVIPNLNWQPVVLHFQEAEEDTLLLPWSTCPEYGRLLEILKKSKEMAKINDKNRQLYEELAMHTGVNVKSPEDVFDIYGTLEAEQTGMKLKLPSWTEKYFPEAMQPLSQLSLKINVYNEELLQLRGSPLLSEIVSNMRSKMNGTLKPEERKMFMYVGHDSTVASLLEAFGVWDNAIPGYNIMIMVELHENDGNWNVQIYLRESVSHKPRPLTIPGCEFACPLNKLINLRRSLILPKEEWKNTCKLKDPNYVPGKAPLP